MTHRSVDSKPYGVPAWSSSAGDSGHRQHRAIRWATTAMLFGMLLGSGCASSPLRYHTLLAVAPTTPAAAYDGPVLQLAVVRLPAELDRAELLREYAPGRFEVSEGDHWAASVSRLARQALSEDLAARLPAGRTAFPGAAWPTPDAQLSIDILSFTLRDGMASMRLSWSLRCVDATVSDAGAQWQLQTPAADEADALSALLGHTADRLAAEPALTKPAGNMPACRSTHR